jgi:hypothetical protein
MSAREPVNQAVSAARVAERAAARAEKAAGLSRNWAAVLIALIVALGYSAPHVTRFLEVRAIAASGEDPLRVYCAASWPSTTDFARVTICEAVASAERRAGGLAYEIGRMEAK